MSNRHQNSMSLMERSRRSLVSPDGCTAAAAHSAETARLLLAHGATDVQCLSHSSCAVARIADLVSLYPEKVTITIGGEKLEPARGQNVISHGPDGNLSVDEIGGIQLVEDAAAAEA